MSRLLFLTKYAEDGVHYDQEPELLKHVSNPKVKYNVYRVFRNPIIRITPPVMDKVVDRLTDENDLNTHARSDILYDPKFTRLLEPHHISKMLDANHEHVIPRHAAFNANTPEMIDKGLNHPFNIVRSAAINNPNTSLEQLKRASTDPTNTERLQREAEWMIHKRKQNEQT